jgi:hypothetical protein
MDTTAGSDPKVILDKALSDQMQKMNQRKTLKAAAAKEKVRKHYKIRLHSNKSQIY